MPTALDNQFPVAKVIGTEKAELTYTDRHSARVVAVQESGEIALIHVKEGNYYKLPGGGIEKDEDHSKAAVREMREETGAVVSIRDGVCIATTEELRFHLHQISCVYIADVVDASGKPELTEGELIDGFTHEWITPLEALEKIQEAQPTSEMGRFVKERDTYLLNEVIKVLQA